MTEETQPQRHALGYIIGDPVAAFTGDVTVHRGVAKRITKHGRLVVEIENADGTTRTETFMPNGRRVGDDLYSRYAMRIVKLEEQGQRIEAARVERQRRKVARVRTALMEVGVKCEATPEAVVAALRTLADQLEAL